MRIADSLAGAAICTGFAIVIAGPFVATLRYWLVP